MRHPMSPEQKEARRLRAVHALGQGLTQSQVARMLGTTCASVSNWAMRFRVGGVEQLRAGRPGRPPRSQARLHGIDLVRLTILRSTPDQLALAGFLWNWRSIQALVLQFCKTEPSRWTVARYLRDWGLQPPDFLVALAAGPRSNADGRYRVLEAKLRADTPRGSLYFVGSTPFNDPSASHADGGSRRSVMWAIGRRGEAAFVVYPVPLRPTNVIDFLERLRLGANLPIFVVSTDRRFSANVIRDWVERRDSKIRLHPVNFGLIANHGGSREQEDAHESQD